MEVKNRDDFIKFLLLFKESLETKPSFWENRSLEAFIEGLYGYILDSKEIEEVNWHILSELLMAARVYE